MGEVARRRATCAQAWVAIAFALLTGCKDAPQAEGDDPGEIIGRVELADNVPAHNCRVLLEGVPLGAKCNDAGEFDIKGVPPGRWEMRVFPGDESVVPMRRLGVAANPGFVSDLGSLRLASPGSVGGHVSVGGAGVPPDAFVAIPSYGVVTAVNSNGGYLLANAPAGVHRVVLLSGENTSVRPDVSVLPSKITIGINFDEASLQGAAKTVSGRAGRTAGGAANITVEVVSASSGQVVGTADTAADGLFSITVPPGAYIVRASETGNPRRAVVPGVIMDGFDDLALGNDLILVVNDDLDGDGIDDEDDPDIDGDGVLNTEDAFPHDPAESGDADSDGVGDRADIRSTDATPVDTQEPTPDSDTDGLLDFEDNCPQDPNMGQEDGDLDGSGDACDNCPVTPNPDQADTLGDGTGDVCRNCTTNDQCPAGQICNDGGCVTCLSNAQCGDRVCIDGACVDCTDSGQCSNLELCDVPRGVCQQCLINNDCAAGESCVFGECLPDCSIDADCPGGFCVSDSCVQCRNTADCPGSYWCDSGTCRAQCTSDTDCTGSNVCDVPTGTCVLSCTASCPVGQLCDTDSICRDVCDEPTFPCPADKDCVGGLCVPQCTTNGDCGSFNECVAGACVPDGTCAADSECPASEMCTGGACVTRPTVLTPGSGYACTSACDCRGDETCNTTSGFCESMPSPTIYLSSTPSGTGDGSSAANASSDFRTSIENALVGERIAILRGDTMEVAGGNATLTQGNVHVTGGYEPCSANRWVYDSSQRSRVRGLQDRGLVLGGALSTPVDDVVLRGLAFEATGTPNPVALEATYAHRLHLKDVVVYLADVPSSGTTGMLIDNSDDILLEFVDVSGVTGANAGSTTALDMSYSYGQINDLSVGLFAQARVARGVIIRVPDGPVTIARFQFDGGLAWDGGAGLEIDQAASTVTVSDANIKLIANPAAGNNSSSEWTGLRVNGVADIQMTNNTVDGNGITAPATGQVQSRRSAVQVINSNGLITDTTVNLPSDESPTLFVAYDIRGPNAGITFSNNNASGGQLRKVHLLSLIDLSTGSFVANNNTLQFGTNTGSLGGVGVYASNVTAPFVIEDSSFEAGGAFGTLNTSHGFLARNSTGRFERCRLEVVGNGYTANAGEVNDGSQIELYQSFLSARGVGSSTNGLVVASATVWAVGNTIEADGGGFWSNGLYCHADSVTFMTSNLISGGTSGARAMVRTTAGATCVDTPANFANNYFWFALPGPHAGDEKVTLVATAATGTPDAAGNIVGDDVTCYLSAGNGNYTIDPTSPCVDAGVAGTRRDGSPIGQDITSSTRVQGAAADIGCFEAM